MNLNRWILRAASWLAPAEQRAEWFAEWSAELYYVERDKTQFCAGAFADALWLRRNYPASPHGLIDSPFACLAILLALAIGSALFAFHLTAARDFMIPLRYAGADNLVMISPLSRLETNSPKVTFEAYRGFTNHTEGLFAEVAFYQLGWSHAGNEPLLLATASSNLFTVLDLPTNPGPQLILMQSVWRSRYRSDPALVGSMLDVNGRPTRVTAILSNTMWRLPQRADGWLLDTGPPPPSSRGYMVGRRIHPQRDWVSYVDIESTGERFQVDRLARVQPLLGFLLCPAVAVLLVATLSSFSLGQYPASGRLRRGGFLGLKFALVTIIVVVGSLDVCYFIEPMLLAHSLLVGFFFGLRWTWTDQRNRCPVCLRRLTSPMRIGCSSRVLLDWYGTEFVCTKGHGMMHVPEFTRTSFSVQRWMQLDGSWNGLFARY